MTEGFEHMSNESFPPPGESQYGTAQGPVAGQDAGSYGQHPYGQEQYTQQQYGQGQYDQPVYASDQAQGGRYATAPVTRPATIDRAVLMMKIGAALSVISGLLSLTMRDAYRDIAQKALSSSGQNVDPAQVDATLNIAIWSGVIGGLVGAALWWWMAVMNGKGKPWARVLSTIFFAISILSFVNNLRSGVPTLEMVLGVLDILIGAAAVWFMWQKPSSQYYEAASRRV